MEYTNISGNLQGKQVYIRPEWQDEGDEEFTWVALCEPNLHTGIFKARRTGGGGVGSIMELNVSHVETVAP